MVGVLLWARFALLDGRTDERAAGCARVLFGHLPPTSTLLVVHRSRSSPVSIESPKAVDVEVNEAHN